MAKRFSKIAILLMLVLALLVPMMVMSVGAEETSATLDLTNASNRTAFSTSSQTWEGNGITVVNNKGASTTNVANYTPPRFYASSNLEISFKDKMTKIVFTASGSSYATALKDSIVNNGDSNVTVSASGNTVTVTFANPVDSFTIKKFSAQVRMGDSIVVYSNASTETSCQHTNTTTTTADATCTTDGSITVTCVDCEEILSTETIPATGHSYDENGECENCDSKLFMPTFNVLGEVKDFDITLAETIELPTVTDVVEGYEFAGWVTTEIATETTTKPTILTGTIQLTADTTFYAVFKRSSSNSTEEEGYTLTDVSHIGVDDTVIIVWEKDGNRFAMSGNGTGSAPSAIKITLSGKTITPETGNIDAIQWKIEHSGDGFIIYPIIDEEKSTWLYSTTSNNGIRVGDSEAKIFKIDASTGYLFNVQRSRYLGVYNSSDIRSYTTVHDNIAGQTLEFYKYSEGATYLYTTNIASPDPECTHDGTVAMLEAKAPTCTTSGLTEGKYCTACGAIIKPQETIPATGHQNTTTTTVAATCTKAGTETVTCDDCGAVLSSNTIDMIAHNYVNGSCDSCGKVDPATIDHSGKYFIAAIRSSGNYWYMTSDLGSAKTKRYQAVDSTLSILPSSICPKDTFVFVLEKNADGTYCIYVDGIDGNNYLGWTSGNSGTLVGENSALRLTIDVTDGLYNIHFAATDEERYLALNNASGNDYFAFYKEGDTINDLSLIPVSDHVWGEGEVTKDATCTETGVMTYTCACGATKTEEIAVVPHTPGAPADCENDQVCTVCGEVLTEKLGHTEVVDAAVAPTCTETGLTEGKHCSVCNVVIVAQEVVAATGHDHEAVVTAPTCTEAGYTTYTCDCGDTYTEVIPATGHNVVDGKCTVCEKNSVITGAALQIGENLAVVYQTVLAGNVADYTMVFTINGGEPVTVVGENGSDGYVYFYFDQIAPQLMGANIIAQLYCGEVEVDVKANYSVRAYCDYYLTGEGAASCTAELRQLLVDLLAYGAAAQVYTNTDVDNLVNEGITGTAGNAVPTESVKNNEFVADANIIDSVGIRFSHDNKIYFILNENATGTVTATVEIGGIVTNAKVEGNTIYTTGINATKLGEKVTVEISIDGVLVQTVTYSVNSYVYAVKDKTDSNANLAKALYNYGESAKAYVDSLK